MAKSTPLLLLLAALLAVTTRAFVARSPVSTKSPASLRQSRQTSTFSPFSSSSSSQLAMSEKPEIEVVSNADQEFLEKKGVFGWSKWGCGVSKFPWTYGDSESCYLLAGKVTVTPDDGRQPATFGKGDFVTFPAGMSCTWDVTEAVDKHYMFF